MKATNFMVCLDLAKVCVKTVAHFRFLQANIHLLLLLSISTSSNYYYMYNYWSHSTILLNRDYI